MNIRVFLFILIGCIFIFNSNASNVQQISSYSTNIQILNDNTLEVSKTISLENIHIIGLIPGEVEFNVGNENLVLNRDSIRAVDIYENIIEFEVREDEDQNQFLILNLQYPILPEFTYTFTLDYSLEFRPKGIFFKTLEIPSIMSSIPVIEGDFTITIPPLNSITYVHPRGETISIDGSTISIDLERPEVETIYLEYSRVPLPNTGVRGSVLFWSFIYFILTIILIRLIIREIRKFYQEQEKY